jgi:hypothetical protein
MTAQSGGTHESQPLLKSKCPKKAVKKKRNAAKRGNDR